MFRRLIDEKRILTVNRIPGLFVRLMDVSLTGSFFYIYLFICLFVNFFLSFFFLSIFLFKIFSFSFLSFFLSFFLSSNEHLSISCCILFDTTHDSTVFCLILHDTCVSTVRTISCCNSRHGCSQLNSPPKS